MKEIISETESHVVCYDNLGTIHYVVINKGNILQTGLPFVDKFDTKEEAVSKVNLIANDENYFLNNFE